MKRSPVPAVLVYFFLDVLSLFVFVVVVVVVVVDDEIRGGSCDSLEWRPLWLL
jgi:hypothetical protein